MNTEKKLWRIELTGTVCDEAGTELRLTGLIYEAGETTNFSGWVPPTAPSAEMLIRGGSYGQKAGDRVVVAGAMKPVDIPSEKVLAEGRVTQSGVGGMHGVPLECPHQNFESAEACLLALIPGATLFAHDAYYGRPQIEKFTLIALNKVERVTY